MRVFWLCLCCLCPFFGLDDVVTNTHGHGYKLFKVRTVFCLVIRAGIIDYRWCANTSVSIMSDCYVFSTV